MLIYGTKNFFAIISIFTFHFLFFLSCFLVLLLFFAFAQSGFGHHFLFNAHWINGVHRNSSRNGGLCVLFMLSNTHLLTMFGNTFHSMLFIQYDVYFITVIDVDFFCFAAYLLHSTILFTSFPCHFEATWNQWRKLRVFQRKMIPLLK